MQRTVASISRSKPQIRDWIYAHRPLFRPGASITEQQLCDFFGITLTIDYMSATQAEIAKAMSSYNITKVNAYTKLNEVLKLRGLAVSAKDHYSEFIVRTRESDNTGRSVEDKLERLEGKALGARRTGRELSDGYQRYAARLDRRISNAELGV